MCKADDATRSLRADLRIGLECAFAPLVVAKSDDAAASGFAGHQGATWMPRVRAAPGHCKFTSPGTYYQRTRAKVPEAAVNRHVILILATLIALIPIDFLFLGIVAKGFFTSEVGDMLGEIRPAPAILSYLLYVRGSWSSSAARTPRRGNRRCCMARCSDCSATRRSIFVVAAEALDLAS